MNLPIRSQIHFIKSNLEPELKDIHSYDTFLSQMLAENIDVDVVSHSYEMATVVILRYLIKTICLKVRISCFLDMKFQPSMLA